MLITGERHLRRVLGEYAGHYNVHRPHRTLQQNPARRTSVHACGSDRMRILRRDRLGGLIHEYAQAHEVNTTDFRCFRFPGVLR